jgi:hypothetical protein
MKRKLLPYGMPLGGAMGGVGSAMGSMGSAAPSSGGGKSSPAPQNAYGSSYQAPAANVYQPSYQGQPAPSSGGGKSSGLGQGGYGAAPGFQQTAQTQPSFGQSPYGAPPPSTYSTTTADMMGGNRGSGQGFGQVMQGLGMMGGGKSSGLGQGGYGMAPGFGGQPQPGMMAPRSGQFRTKEQEAALDQQGGMGGQINLDDFMTGGGRFNPYQQTSQVGSQQGMGALGGMGGFGGQQRFQQPQLQPGMSFDQFKQSGMMGQGPGGVSSEFANQQYQDYLNQQGGMGDTGMNRAMPSGITTTAAQRAALGMPPPSSNLNKSFGSYGGGFQQQPQFNPFQQQFGRFQPPQQQFNPFQQQFGGFQQQPQNISGLQGLFNQMMGQQQMPMQRQPMQQYQDPALQYRPNMQNAQSALSRVRPSVQRQQQDAQSARIAELETQLAGFQTPTSNPYDDGYAGGG